jgi:replicative DNA helicase
MIILAARPSQGKTGLASQIAVNVARLGEPVLFCSLEMSSEQIMARLLCAEAGVNTAVVRGDVADFNREKLTNASNKLAGLPIRFTDEPHQSVGVIAAQARTMIQDGGLGLVIVDQLSLVEPLDRRDYREQQVSNLSKAFKAMARSLQVPVLLLCQINRSNEQKSDNRPTLASLRESGQIEADADVVLAIHRPGFYKKDADDNTADVIVLKNRHGPTKPDIELTWQAAFTRFANQAAVDMPNYQQGFDDFNSGEEF